MFKRLNNGSDKFAMALSKELGFLLSLAVLNGQCLIEHFLFGLITKVYNVESTYWVKSTVFIWTFFSQGLTELLRWSFYGKMSLIKPFVQNDRSRSTRPTFVYAERVCVFSLFSVLNLG